MNVLKLSVITLDDSRQSRIAGIGRQATVKSDQKLRGVSSLFVGWLTPLAVSR